jgi:cytochrome P450
LGSALEPGEKIKINGEYHIMARKVPALSLWDNLFYNFVHVLPYYSQGIFTRNRFWVSFWSRFHPDPAAVKFIHRLRRKYQSDCFYIRMLTTQSLLLLNPEDIKRVLDNSPLIYAEAGLKRRGMSHFQPNAVTISRGEEWKERRRFNESVLNFGQGIHEYADRFLEAIRTEIKTRQYRGWGDFAELFERITLQIVVGKGVYDTELTGLLEKMMRESNRVFGLRKSKYFDDFYGKIRHYLKEPPEAGLVARCGQVPATDKTQVENQIPHWLFAMKDTLASNTVCALALIVAHPEAERRVREELAQADLASPQGIHGLRYLEGCVQEAMRLWPSVSLLVRETVATDTLGDVSIPPQTQVLILNTFNHRDREALPFADTFSPQEWLSGQVNYRFNHLSNGTQVCAGKDLTLFIAKAVLATLLSQHRYTLNRPRLNPAKPLPYTYNYFGIDLNSAAL